MRRSTKAPTGAMLIWKIGAFLQRLPELSPEQYQEMKHAAQQGGDGYTHGGGGHGGGTAAKSA